jgi:hypothetical protein
MPVEADPVGQRSRVVLALGQRDALVQPEQVRVLRVLVLHDDHDVVEPSGELRRERVERVGDVALELRRRDRLHWCLRRG